MAPLAAFSPDEVYSLLDAAALAIARPFGTTAMFTVFAWGKLQTGIIRIVFALSLSLPMLARQDLYDTAAAATGADGMHPAFLFLMLKEMMLGFVIGALASLPLEAIGAAGFIVDSLRGSGHVTSPTGDDTPLGQLFMIIALWMFASLGGFYRFADTVYASYGLWPVGQPLPPINGDAVSGLLSVSSAMIGQAAVLAGAMVAVLLMTDLTLLIASLIGRKMQMLELSQSVKAAVVLATAPLYALLVARVATERLPDVFSLRLLQLAFPR